MESDEINDKTQIIFSLLFLPSLRGPIGPCYLRDCGLYGTKSSLSSLPKKLYGSPIDRTHFDVPFIQYTRLQKKFISKYLFEFLVLLVSNLYVFVYS